MMKMSVLFESVAEEIFNKFDVEQTGILTYPLFKAFCDTVNHPMSPSIFNEQLGKLLSTKFTKTQDSKATG